nr:VP2 [Mute swan feces associated ambidensovirus 2]
MDVYSPLLEEPLSKKKWIERLPERLKNSNVGKGYSNYVKHFKQLRANPGLRHRPSNYTPIEESIELNEITGGEEDVIFDAIDAGAGTSYGAISAGTGAAAAASAGTSIGATAGTGLGILGTGAIVGGIVSAVSGKEERDPVFTLPDHKFLGPGNTIDDKTPLDLDDEFARVHDILYANALTQHDISKADEHFLEDTVSDIIDNGNWHSLVSYLGIQLKHTLENIVGVQYPNGLPTIVSGKKKCQVELMSVKDLLLKIVLDGQL